MTGFICHDDYLNKTSKLTDEEVGRLFRACMMYHATGELVELDGRESIAFDFIREDIDRAEKAYQEKCETNRRNRMSKKTGDDDGERSLTDVKDCEPTSIIKEQYKEKENIKNNNNKKSTRFAPPSIEEVTQYCQERGNNVNPQQFINFYESKGWKVGSSPMKDWKACIRTWEQRDGRGGARDYPQQKKFNAYNFEQRDYSGVDDEIMQELTREVERYRETGEVTI